MATLTGNRAIGKPIALNVEARDNMDGAAGFENEAVNDNCQTAHEIGDAAPLRQGSVDHEQTGSFTAALLQHAELSTGQFVLTGIAEGCKPKIRRVSASDLSAALAVAETWNREGCNIYYGAALIKPDLPPGARGGRDDAVAMLAIVIDIDEGHAAAAWEERAKALPGLWPSAVIRTSGTPTPRYQLVYFLKEPETNIAAWERVARGLERHFGADHCSKDRAHLWRLPGTINWPNQKKRAAGRVPETAQLVSLDPERRFDLIDFDCLPDAPAPSPSAIDLAPMEPTAAWDSAGAILARLPGWLQGKILENDIHTDGRSTFDWQIAKETARAGLNAADLCALYCLSANEPFASKWREKEMQRPGLGDAYLMRTFAKAAQEVANELPPPTDAHPADEAGEANDDLFPLLGLADLAALPPVSWLVEGFIPNGSLCLMYGPPKQGKSFIALDMMLHVAYGKPWHGRPVDQGAVVYIVAEGKGGFGKRTEAWRKAHECASKDAPFKALPRPIQMLDLAEADRLVRTIRAKFPPGTPIRAVVIDTLARCFAGGDENSTKDMTAFVAACDRIREELGAAVIVVHHTGKDRDRGSRGSNALPAAIDAAFEVTKSKSTVTLKTIFQKDADEAPPISFEMKSVEVVNAETGEKATSCVLEESNEPALPGPSVSNDNEPKLGPKQRLLLSIVQQAGPDGLPNIDLRKLAKEAGIERDGTFYDARTALVKLGLVIDDNGIYRTA